MNKNISKIDQKIADLQRDIEHLIAEKEKYVGLSLSQRIAEVIHEKTCNYNHTDGCGWYYGSWKNPRDEHIRYHNKAIFLLKLIELLDKNMTDEQIEKFINDFLTII
jgi:hypothetical protein